jgi:hypothetical protein
MARIVQESRISREKFLPSLEELNPSYGLCTLHGVVFDILARRMGGAQRYPSIAVAKIMGFAKSSTHPTGLRQNNPTGKSPKVCPPPRAKIFRLTRRANQCFSSARPTPPEGRLAIVTDAGWDAVDAAAFCARRDCRAGRKICERSPSERTRDVAAYGEVVWS